MVSVIDTTALRPGRKSDFPMAAPGCAACACLPMADTSTLRTSCRVTNSPPTQIERGWIQTNGLSVIHAVQSRLVNSVLLDDINLGAANPWGIACTGDGKSLLVAHAGTHEVSVIDRPALHRKLEETGRGEKVSDVSTSGGDVVNDLAFLTGLRLRVPLKGNGPRALAAIGSTLLRGRVLHGHSRRGGTGGRGASGQPFNQAWRRSTAHRRAARRDALSRRAILPGKMAELLQLPSRRRTAGRLELGPDARWRRQCEEHEKPPASHRTPPTTVTGFRPNAEASVRAGFRYIQFAERPEEDAVSVDAYLKSLRPAPSPYLEDGRLSAAGERGKQVFEKTGCRSCHAGTLYTDMRKHNVGTGRGQEEGIEYDVPTLVEIWRTAPYLHDGRSPTLKHFSRRPAPAPCIT